MNFDLGLLESQDHSIFESPCSSKTLEQQMEEDKIGWLECTSDLQAFMDIGALPEIKDDEDVNVVIDDVEKLIQEYDEKQEEDYSEIFPPEELAAAEDLLDELLKSNDISLEDIDQAVVNPEPVPEEENLINLTNVTKIVKDDGQEIYIMIAPQEESVDLDDSEDWAPDSPKVAKGRPTVKRQPKSKRKAPYIVDKKERKKQQNVEAARRYRDKKKAEQNVAEEEERLLEVHHKELKSQVAELEAEVKTMKKLMKELGILIPPK